MKSTMALPGLEPQSETADEDLLAHAAPEPCKNSGTCEEPSVARAPPCAGLPAVHCSNVANALRDLLELAKQAGIDPDHPAMKAAAGALEELAAFIAGPGSGDCRTGE